MFVPHPAKRLSIAELSYLVTGVILAAAVAYYFVSSHSVVYLRYPKESASEDGWKIINRKLLSVSSPLWWERSPPES